MYYMLECYGPIYDERQAIESEPTEESISWMTGRPLVKQPETPIEVVMDGDGLMMPMFNRGILIFRDDLIQAIKDAGVDNLDYYDTVLFDPVANVRFENYKAVNIIGRMAVADLSRSQYTAISGSALTDTVFESVAIDKEKASGFLMFRMAESVNAIVIHEKVKQHIEQAGIPHLNIIQPEDWFG